MPFTLYSITMVTMQTVGKKNHDATNAPWCPQGERKLLFYEDLPKCANPWQGALSLKCENPSWDVCPQNVRTPAWMFSPKCENPRRQVSPWSEKTQAEGSLPTPKQEALSLKCENPSREVCPQSERTTQTKYHFPTIVQCITIYTCPWTKSRYITH